MTKEGGKVALKRNRVVNFLGLVAFVVAGMAMSLGSGQPFSAVASANGDPFVEVARRAPAFGGAYVDPADNDLLYLYLTDPAGKDEAERAVKEITGRQPREVRVLEAQYGYLQLSEWHDRLSPVVLALPNVVSTDVDEARNRLAVGVMNGKARRAVEEQLDRLGIPHEAVTFSMTGPVMQLTEAHEDAEEASARPTTGRGLPAWAWAAGAVAFVLVAAMLIRRIR